MWFQRRRATPDKVEWDRIEDTVRLAQNERAAQTMGQRDLVLAVSALLFEADPVGINFTTNTDEYDAEAETIVIALSDASGPHQLPALVHTIFVHWFDAATAGPVERYAPLAEPIWELWRGHLDAAAPTWDHDR